MTFHTPLISAAPRAVLLTGPFGAPERIITLARPMTIAEVIAAHGLAFRLPTIAVMGGEPVLRGVWALRMVRPGETVAFIAVPGGGGQGGSGKQIIGLVAAVALSVAAPGVGTAVAGALFGGSALAASVASAAFLVGGSLLLNTLMPPAANATAGSETIYTANASSNSATPLEVVPVLYGRLRFPPRYASRPYSEFQGNDQFLYQLFAVTAGKAAIEKIEIGDTEAWNSTSGYSDSFTDLSFQIIPPGGSVTLFPANVITSSEVAAQVVPDPAAVLGPFVVNASGSTIDRIAVDFAFPAGLFSQNKKGVANNSIPLRAQYQKIDNAGAPIGGWADIFQQTITMATRTPQRLTRAIDVTAGRYQVKFFAEGAFKPDGDPDVNKCVWMALRGYLTGFVTPPNCTLLAMKIKANEQLSSASAQQINVTATRHLPTHSPGGGWAAANASRSIAWAAADMLRDTDYGLGLSDGQYDLAALDVLNTTWAGRGDTFNALFDRVWTASDALRAILRAGRTQPVRIAGKLGFVRLEPKVIKRAVFTPRNVVRGSFSHKLVLFDDEKPDSVTASFFDETVWDTREVEASIGAIGNDAPQKQDYFGITDHDHAWREAVTDAAINAYQREFVSFTAEWEGKLLIRGEPILVQHPFIEGVAHAAVAVRSGRMLTVDRDVEAPAGDGYVIVRGKDGREWGPCLVESVVGRTITLDATDYAAVQADMGTLTNIMPVARAELAHLLLCEGDMRPFNGLVVSATPSGGKVNILAVIDAPEVYTADGTETKPSPWTIPSLPTKVPTRPLVFGLYGKLRASVAGIELDAMWTPASGATLYVAHVSYDDGVSWTRVYRDDQNRFTTSVLPQPLRLRVAAIGEKQGPWATMVFGILDVPDARVTPDYIYPITQEQLGEDLAELNDWLNSGGTDIPAMLDEVAQRTRDSGIFTAGVAGLLALSLSTGILAAEQDFAHATQEYHLRTATGVGGAASQAYVLSQIDLAAGPGSAIAQSLDELGALVDDNAAAITNEAAARVTAVSAEAATRSILEAQVRGAYSGADPALVTSGLIYELRQLQITGDAANAASIAAISISGLGSFDPASDATFWHFNSSVDGWTGNGTPTASGGLLRPANHASDPYVVSPDVLGVDASTFGQVRFRLKKTGSPTWDGFVYWQGPSDSTWDNARRTAATEPTWLAGYGEVSVNMGWTGTIDQIRIDTASAMDASNYHQIDWVGVGRGAPGASLTAVQSLTGRLATAENDIDGLTTSVTGVQTSLAGKADTTVTDSQASRITAAESGLALLGQKSTRVSSSLLPIAANSAEADFAAALGLHSDRTALAQAGQDFQTAIDLTEAGIDVVAANLIALSTTLTGVSGQADLTSTAVGLLTTRVTASEGVYTAHGDALTALQSALSGYSGSNAVSTALFNLTTDVSAAQGTADTANTAAGAAQSTADSKTKTFRQTSAPTATTEGDTWYDTDDGNKQYRASAPGPSNWVAVDDARIEATSTALIAVTSTVDGVTAQGRFKTTAFASATAGWTNVALQAVAATTDNSLLYKFDSTVEGWSGNGTPTVASGLLRPANHATDPYVLSPGGLGLAGATYSQVRLRIKKTGSPAWDGYVYWKGPADSTWSTGRRAPITQPTYASAFGVAVVDMGWTGTIDQIRIELSSVADASNYFEIDFVAIDRPVTASIFLQASTGGASRALLKATETLIIDASDNILGLFDASGAAFDTARIINLTATNLRLKGGGYNGINADDVVLNASIFTNLVKNNAFTRIFPAFSSGSLAVGGASYVEGGSSLELQTITIAANDIDGSPLPSGTALPGSVIVRGSYYAESTGGDDSTIFTKLAKNGTTQKNFSNDKKSGSGPMIQLIEDEFASPKVGDVWTLRTNKNTSASGNYSCTQRNLLVELIQK